VSDEESREEEPGRRANPLAWGIVAAAVAGAAWLAFHPLPSSLPQAERPVRLPSMLEEEPQRESEEPRGVEEPQGGSLPRETPGEPEDAPESEPAPDDEPAEEVDLRATIERRLAMNGLAGLRVEIAGDEVVTHGELADPRDRPRLALIVSALAPGLRHRDRTIVVTGMRRGREDGASDPP
jgi:hypothetical protein